METPNNKSRHLLAKEYQIPLMDQIYEASKLPLDKNPMMNMLGKSMDYKYSQKLSVPGLDGNTVDLYVFRPTKLTKQGPLPILYFMHGGGYIMGTALTICTPPDDVTNALQAIMVSIDYRIATVKPFPADLHDAYAGLEYVYKHAAELGGDPNKIVVTGESAGGGLAARLALYNRDFGNVPICGQALTYPKLDCRTATDKQPIVDPYAGEYGWTPVYERMGEEALQGRQTIPEDKIQYMSPSLAKDLSNLPPAFIIVGSLDLLCMEDITYAQRLICAGVNVELHVVPGVPHGFDAVLPDSPQTQLYHQLRYDAIRRMIEGLDGTY